MSRVLDITVMMDIGAISPEDTDFMKEPQSTTEGHVVNALRELGHRVRILGIGYDITAVVHDLTEHPPSMVFNLTEQFRDDRVLDKNVAGILELMKIPFTGAGASGLMLCRDKGLCKQILGLHKIRIPDFLILPPGETVHIPKSFPYPAVVKPIYEDASDGISNASIVRNEGELLDRSRFVHQRWNQLAIIEEYIEGREMYVAVLGNKRLTVLPPREIRFGDRSGDGPVIATSRVKWDKEYRDKWKIGYGFAQLSDELSASISRACKKVYRLLRIHDFGRIDIRVTSENRIVVLEANPNPDIAYGEDVAEAAAKSGIDYRSLVDRILRAAVRRYET